MGGGALRVVAAPHTSDRMLRQPQLRAAAINAITRRCGRRVNLELGSDLKWLYCFGLQVVFIASSLMGSIDIFSF